MTGAVLIRYGELALKSPPVRREFERVLGRNILAQFRILGVTCRLRADHGHLYVYADDPAVAVKLLRRVFGVTSVSEVTEVSSEVPEIGRRLLELADPQLRPGVSFAVRARRTGQHTFTSQELARELGGQLLAQWPDRGLRVDLDHPEVELNVEVRGPRTYLYLDRQIGPGGLPLGVAGHVVALVDGRRGALGAFLMMKRGCKCAIVATGDGDPLARGTLARFDPQAEIVPPQDDPERVLEGLAAQTRADGMVLPLAMEGYPAARDRWGDRVLFSPTVGMTDEEVGARWRGVVELAG